MVSLEVPGCWCSNTAVTLGKTNASPNLIDPSDIHTTIIISAPVFTDLVEPLSSAVALTRLHFFSRRRPSLAHYGTIIAYQWLCLLVTHTDPLVPLSFMQRWASHSVWAPLWFALAAWRVVVLGC